RLLDAAEEAKVRLSQQAETRILLPYLTPDETGTGTFDEAMTRTTAEHLTRPLMDRCRRLLEEGLRQARWSPSSQLSWSRVDEVVLTGQATRWPAVADLVRRVVQREPTRGRYAEGLTAAGAAIQAAQLALVSAARTVVSDVSALTLSLVLPGGTCLPLVR